MPNPKTNLTAARDEMVRKLSALTLHDVRGEPEPDDAARLRQDLEAVWRIVDQFVERFGEYANSALGDIDVNEFRGQLEGALDGNASYELSVAEERLTDEAREYWDARAAS